MDKPKKKATLSHADFRKWRELLQAELKPLKDEVRKLRKDLQIKDNGN